MLVPGIWFTFSPFMLGYPDPTGIAAINSHVFGAIVTVLATAALMRPRMWEEWVNLALGLWLIAAPFVLGFGADRVAAINHILFGILITADALWALMDVRAPATVKIAAIGRRRKRPRERVDFRAGWRRFFDAPVRTCTQFVWRTTKARTAFKEYPFIA